MTVKEFVYDLYFMNYRKKNEKVVFKLVERGDDLRNYAVLIKGDMYQPVSLYDKRVVKFWVDNKRGDFVIYVIYEDDEQRKIPIEVKTDKQAGEYADMPVLQSAT